MEREAAARELLEALSGILDCDGSDHPDEDGHHTLTPHAEHIARALAAIREALKAGI